MVTGWILNIHVITKFPNLRKTSSSLLYQVYCYIRQLLCMEDKVIAKPCTDLQISTELLLLNLLSSQHNLRKLWITQLIDTT